jgi:hypothetical protein
LLSTVDQWSQSLVHVKSQGLMKLPSFEMECPRSTTASSQLFLHLFLGRTSDYAFKPQDKRVQVSVAGKLLTALAKVEEDERFSLLESVRTTET